MAALPLDPAWHPVCRLLARGWLPGTPCPELTAAELDQAARLLLATGGGALAWWRLRESPLRDHPSARPLQAAYRMHALRAALAERSLRDAVTRLEAAGATPVLVKGWAIARLYPEPGLRPYGDLDLYVHPHEAASAVEALAELDREVLLPVELHAEPPAAYDRPLAALWEGARLLPLPPLAPARPPAQRAPGHPGTRVRVPAPEEHLRLLCLHFLQHGAWRPLWLFDLAVLLESSRAGFDWDRCLARPGCPLGGTRAPGEPRHTEWVGAALALARDLLGLSLAGAPDSVRERRLPDWVARAVLRQWEAGPGGSTLGPFTGGLGDGSPGLRARLQGHWRNPVQATIELGAPFDAAPRLPLQVAATLRRVPGAVRALLGRARP